MKCPKCGGLDYGIIGTKRGITYDLREAHCKNVHCRKIFYQKIVHIKYEDYENLLKALNDCGNDKNQINMFEESNG
jgi:hypothetical protein